MHSTEQSVVLHRIAAHWDGVFDLFRHIVGNESFDLIKLTSSSIQTGTLMYSHHLSVKVVLLPCCIFLFSYGNYKNIFRILEMYMVHTRNVFLISTAASSVITLQLLATCVSASILEGCCRVKLLWLGMHWQTEGTCSSIFFNQ